MSFSARLTLLLKCKVIRIWALLFPSLFSVLLEIAAETAIVHPLSSCNTITTTKSNYCINVPEMLKFLGIMFNTDLTLLAIWNITDDSPSS